MKPLTRTKAILADLIGFATVSTDSNFEMIRYLADQLEGLGARVELFQDPSGTKANLFATLGPEVGGGIVLSGHTDVVPVTDQDWSFDPFEMHEKDGLLYGRGACDMKGYIAACIAIAPVFAAADLKRPVHFSFTYDEETGCLGAQALVAELKKRDLLPDLAIIGEPTEMRVIEGNKGCYEYTTRFKGLEGHGSAPDEGVNAAEYAVLYVSRLLELREELKTRTPPTSQFEPPWSTLNIGRIEGGVAHNVIVGKAEVDWEMRPVVTADADFVKDAIGEYVEVTLLPAMRSVAPDATIETKVIAEVCGLEPAEANAARDLVMELTGANGTDLVPFGTEAGLFQEIGLDVVVCGPGSIAQAHKPDEFVSLDQLEVCLDMLGRLAERCQFAAT